METTTFLIITFGGIILIWTLLIAFLPEARAKRVDRFATKAMRILPVTAMVRSFVLSRGGQNRIKEMEFNSKTITNLESKHPTEP